MSRSIRPDEAEIFSCAPIGSLVRTYLAHIRQRVKCRDYSSGAFERTERYLTSFLDHQGDGWPCAVKDLAFGSCHQLHFVDWLTANLGRWKRGSTRLDAIGSVLTCFNWLENTDLINRNPFRKPKDVKTTRTHRSPMLPGHYLAIMRQAMPKYLHQREGRRRGSMPLRRAMLFLWHTGARTCELYSLQWAHIVWEERGVRITDHKTAHCTGEPRSFALGTKVYRMLRRMYARRTLGQSHIFLDNYGQPWTKDSFGRHFGRYARAANIPRGISAYCARHGFAVRLVEKGIATKGISDQLGHRDGRMLDSVYAAYTRSKIDHMRRVVDQAERKVV